MTNLTVLPDDFAALNLPQPLERAILELGFQNTTPVQTKVLPHSLDGLDIIAQAQTGTGKTAAFLISIITYDLENPVLDSRPRGTPFALIIAPTRELVMQIASDAKPLIAFSNIKIVPLVGGMDYEKQKAKLTKPIDIVVATPGRLLDFARNNHIDLSEVEILVIDEADRMLSMGFIPDVKAIVSRTPRKENRQTQLFSATYSEDIKRLASSWTLDPIRIEIEPEQIAVDTVEQKVFLTSEEEKYKVLYNLIKIEKIERVLIFGNRRDQCRDLESRLRRHGFKTGLLAGDVPQKKRIRTLDDFKSGKIGVLVATDVAGRGLHIDNITHVINYNLPEDPEDYVHRIGRTGRAGAEGISITLACENESFMLPSIEALLGESLKCQNPPNELNTDIPPLPPMSSEERSSIPKRNNSSNGRQGPRGRRY